jgi:hypothetical protein
MAAPVVQSSNTASVALASSLTITKPTGLAVGDTMICFMQFYDSNTATTYTTPSGWTNRGSIFENGARKMQVFSKVAESADVAASNFTFAFSETVNATAGILIRVNGVGQFFSIETDFVQASSTSISFTAASTPLHADTLLIMAFGVAGGTNSPTFGSYTSTPSNTWTEIAEITIDEGAEDPSVAAAYATTSTLSELTNYGATLSTAATYKNGCLILIHPIVSATGTNALLQVSPTVFGNAGAEVGVTGTNALLQPTPQMFNPSGTGSTPTQWANETKPSTSWDNDTI